MGLFRRKNKEILEQGLEVPPPPSAAEELPSTKDVASIRAVKEAVEKGPVEIPKPKREIVEVSKPKMPSMEQIETRAAAKQKEELEEREELKLTKPLFIHAEPYRELLEDLGLTKGILKENEEIIERVINFKEDQDKEFKKWELIFKDMQKKLIFIDKSLFGIK